MFYMLIKTKYEGFFSETLTGSISGSAAPIEGGAKSFMQTSKGGRFLDFLNAEKTWGAVRVTQYLQTLKHTMCAWVNQSNEFLLRPVWQTQCGKWCTRRRRREEGFIRRGRHAVKMTNSTCLYDCSASAWTCTASFSLGPHHPPSPSDCSSPAVLCRCAGWLTLLWSLSGCWNDTQTPYKTRNLEHLPGQNLSAEEHHWGSVTIGI